jgi:hypothetical protein
LVTLDRADHLISDQNDIELVAMTTAAFLNRYARDPIDPES